MHRLSANLTVDQWLDGELKYNVHLAAFLGGKGVQRLGGEGAA